MTQSYRLPAGGRIDRARTLQFQFDGRPYAGHPGDTLASALLANGIRLVGRSFKRHRPRGLLGIGGEEPNALVDVGGEPSRRTPNTLATRVELADGLVARSQNRWPSLSVDVGSLAGAFSPLLPAGFYYKTFMWPAQAWPKLYEPMIRRMAGLGVVPGAADADSYACCYAHCDVLVVGGGPAGICAALAAAEQGLDVVLCEEDVELGGSLLARPDVSIDGIRAWEQLRRWKAELERAAVRSFARTVVFGAFADNMFGLCERLTREGGPRERLSLMRARAVVLATGAIERPLVFRNNDRPGVMLASAVSGYAGRYGVKAGERLVLCAHHDSGYEAATIAACAGCDVVLVDQRATAGEAAVEAARAAGVEVIFGWGPADIRGVFGVTAIGLAPAGARRPQRWLACDVVGMAGGWTPAVHLHAQIGGALEWDAPLRAYLPRFSRPDWFGAGACEGVLETHEAALSGRRAGEAAAAAVRGAPIERPSKAKRHDAERVGPAPAVSKLAFVDFQNDVTTADLRLAQREGFRSIEHVKRYTTLGMGADQGRTSALNALEFVAQTSGRSAPEIGLTSYRPPFAPVSFGAMAGRNRGALFDALRVTAIDRWAEDHGAVFENVALWRRARYFPRPGETMREAVARECRATRAAAGLFDASTLGKIEVVGPDAVEFMNRIYVNAWTKLAVGRCRYGVMLREDGFLLDDGVVGRLADDRFHVTTTTGGAPAVLHHMEDYLQTEFPELRVWLTSTTEQWAVIAVNGPAARDILRPLVSGIDMSPEAMRHMSVREGTICGTPCRLFRVSFTGELGFEINVPSNRGGAVWQAVFEAGRPQGLTPYGTETMHVLRAEKGYIIVGQETDGTVTPHDLGLDWCVGKKKRGYVGMRSLQRSGLTATGRLQLVGLMTLDRATVLDEGAQLIAEPGARNPEGHVTSAYWSETLGQPIALGLLADGRSRVGETIMATRLDGPAAPLKVVESVFYDPHGSRLDG